MPGQTTRPDSAQLQFVRRVPSDVLPRVQGKCVVLDIPAVNGARGFKVATTLSDRASFSLRTRDPAVAELRSAAAIVTLEKVYEAARRGPVRLSQRDRVAYSAEAYRLLCENFLEDPGQETGWASFKAFTRAAMEGRILSAPPVQVGVKPAEVAQARDVFGDDLTAGINAMPQSNNTAALEARFGIVLSWVLSRHGLNVDADTRADLLRKVAEAALDAGWRLKRAAGGDYSPDPKEARFPPIPTKDSKGGVTLTALFEKWAAETKPAASTLSTWRGSIGSLREHLKHDDAKRITADDVIAWKDSLVAAGRSPKTINDGHLAALRALLGFGVKERLLTENVAVGIRVAAKKRAGQGRLPYTDEEVGRLLALVRTEEAPHLRWLPWLCALSGARIGEVAQLWGNRVTTVDGLHVLELRPAEDGGSFKNEGSERTVPIHPALVAEGFLAFVKARGDGPLFYRRSSGDPNRKHASKAVTNRVAEWVRASGFRDPRKAPAHSLRHWFKSAASRAGVQDSLADAIQGHAGKSDADGYRHHSVPDLFKAVSAILVPPIPDITERPTQVAEKRKSRSEKRRRETPPARQRPA